MYETLSQHYDMHVLLLFACRSHPTRVRKDPTLESDLVLLIKPISHAKNKARINNINRQLAGAECFLRVSLYV